MSFFFVFLALNLHLKEYDDGKEILRIYSELNKLFTAELFLHSHQGSTFIMFSLCIYISEKPPEMEVENQYIYSAARKTPHFSKAHNTNRILESNIFLGQRLCQFSLIFQTVINPFPHCSLPRAIAHCTLPLKSLKTQITNFLVLDGVGKPFDVFEVKITHQRSRVKYMLQKKYILVKNYILFRKTKTKDPVI